LAIPVTVLGAYVMFHRIRFSTTTLYQRIILMCADIDPVLLDQHNKPLALELIQVVNEMISGFSFKSPYVVEVNTRFLQKNQSLLDIIIAYRT
jgi:hypothetical protein